MIHKQNSDELVGYELHGINHVAPKVAEEHSLWKRDE